MDKRQFSFLVGALERLDAKMDFIFKWAREQLDARDEEVTGSAKASATSCDDADL